MAVQSTQLASSWHGHPRPGWKSGYARYASESVAPELWRGLIGAWCPNLGYTGNSFPDVSGHRNAGLYNVSSPDLPISQFWEVQDLAGYTWNQPAGAALAFVTIGALGGVPGFDSPAVKTWMLWAKPRDLAGGFKTLMEFGNDDPWSGINGSTAAYFSAALSFNGATTLSVDTWHHIAWSNGPANGVSLYVNGWLDGSGVQDDQTSDTLGIMRNAGDINFPGWVDDARVYNRELSAAEVMQNYNLGPGGIYMLKKRVFGPVPAPVVVCTDGVWSTPISFLPCDDFRVTIDGPAADDVKISATMELQE